ncbi:hypothetical protein N0V88_007074 [Collariella sp. IMI 366227]|nr:hypothetical protein N0V88_007074 [Collariella sp. IMI 366227]
MAGCFKLFFQSRRSKKALSEKPCSSHPRPVRISDFETPLLHRNSSNLYQRVPYSSRSVPNYLAAQAVPKIDAEAAANESPEEAARRKKAEEEEQERLDFFQMM